MNPDIVIIGSLVTVASIFAMGLLLDRRTAGLAAALSQERAARRLDNRVIHDELELHRVQIELLRARLNKKAVKALQSRVSDANLRLSQHTNTQDNTK